MKLRIKFRKFGPVKFIGHLDVMRFFQKALRRADIDVAYSGGFSPHQIMSFAAPLGVGLESNGEYFDVEILSPISSQEFMDKVNAVSVPWIQITDVRLLPDKAGNAMASVAAAGYTISFRESRSFENGWQQKFEEFMSQAQIIVTKATKKGTAEIDLKPAIYDYKVEEDRLYLLVNASSEGNIKPTLVMDAFAVYLGENLQENALLITREETYGSKVDEDGNVKFIPLADFGEWMES
ncbi:MAG: TIGR03936 family radical SAM-associated protein [Lachnospiraceae bacterium]|nr:TIGR03936 family radical SAM-associated protein [Lachnospiraceae bacterium]